MRRLVAIFAVVAVVFVGCGGGDSSDSDDSSDTAAEPAESPSTEAPFASDDDEEQEDACLTADKAKTEITVKQVDVMFKPEKLEAPAGEMVTVVVQNTGDLDHTFTSEDLDCDSGYISPGTKTAVTFKMPDKPVKFICIPHEQAMTGSIVPT